MDNRQTDQLTDQSTTGSNQTFALGPISSPADFLVAVRKVTEEIAKAEGCYLYDLEFVGQGGNRALRVYVEKDAEQGVGIDDCSNISRRLSEVLEANEDAIPGGAYDLEVSSPGLERTLREPWHFEKVIGKKITVKSSEALLQFNQEVSELGLAKQIQGRLVSFDDRGLRVEFTVPSKKAAPETAPAVLVPFNTVIKAHVVFEFENSSASKPGQRPGKGAKEKRGQG